MLLERRKNWEFAVVAYGDNFAGEKTENLGIVVPGCQS